MSDESDGPALEWRSWPAAERPRTWLVAAPVCAGAVGAVWLLTRDVWWVAGAATLLAIGLREYLAPVRYRLDAKGATVTYWLWSRHLGWNRVRRVSLERTGVFLSPFAAPSRIENHRGMHLRYSGNRDAVAAAINRFRPSA
ncbi:MAG: hypothetical protein IT350_12660 [Deltaproteobacteria bacterium]|nr:hypothetical protein [Deltaproteobacteria bacterium]